MSPELIDAIGRWLELGVTAAGAMLFALWAGTIVWTINDMRARSFDLGAIVLAAALVALMPFVGAAVYLLVRPKETLADAYERALEEDALLGDRSVNFLCHSCDSPVREEWVFCPTCQAQLLTRCSHCSRNRRVEWKFCAYCRSPQQGAQQGRTAGIPSQSAAGQETGRPRRSEFARPAGTPAA